METVDQTTQFAPARRAPDAEVQREAENFAALSPLLRPLLDAVPTIVTALNDERQIILANRALLTFIHTPESGVLGHRLGEALDCVHARDQAGGCGCSEFCSTCGAMRAILASQTGRADVQECRITRKSGDALDLRVWATPFPMGDEHYTIFAVEDISHEKRRRALERVFFHDVLNTAMGIRVTANQLRRVPDNTSAALSIIPNLLDRLIEEIEIQRQLTAAECGELDLDPVSIDVTALLYEVAHLYGYGGAETGPRVLVDAPQKQLRLVSDRTLLRRVIGNMLRNAVEASQPADTVTLGCREGEQEVEFWVHNPGYMPRDVQLQLFQRSFSTKGSGRGLGTYSIRLLTEQYLRGSIAFTSSPEAGTTFTARYPLLL
jgi:nitrogen fixation/metabolism regulation signal transduction histidine kinase